jgi:uncharacterized membrane protein
MKKFFAKGLMALLPLVLTAVVLYFAVGFLYNNVGVPIGEGLKWAAENWGGIHPPSTLPDGRFDPTYEWTWFFRWGAPLVGFAVAIVLTLAVGFVVATFLGNKIYHFFETILSKLPIVKVIYPYARQFTDFFFSADEKRKGDFKHAVAVPFPTVGLYSIGFVTGGEIAALNEATRKSMVCVFVPTSPTPFTGYVVYVPQEEVIPLPISIEEAMRIIISAGVLHPSPAGPAAVPVPADLARPLPRGTDKA